MQERVGPGGGGDGSSRRRADSASSVEEGGTDNTAEWVSIPFVSKVHPLQSPYEGGGAWKRGMRF